MITPLCIVAPLIGVGIEITITSQTPFKPKVAPLIGAWIEIEQLLVRMGDPGGRTFCWGGIEISVATLSRHP